MIVLTDRWSVYRDRYQWVLVETYQARPSKQYPEGREKTRESYHPWLDQALRWAADMDCENAPGLESVGEKYASLIDSFKATINKPDRSALEIHARCKDLENENANLREKLRAGK